MSKTKKLNSQKYIIVAIALGLAAVGYFGYRSMLVTPDINKIDNEGPRRERGGVSPMRRVNMGR